MPRGNRRPTAEPFSPTTVIGTLNPDATITVYDNGDHNAQGQNIIGAHQPTYWTGTNPGMITIYQLDPNHQYLIEGTGEGEFIQGSVFGNLIRPRSGRDTIAGRRTNEIQGTLEELDEITVRNFHDGSTSLTSRLQARPLLSPPGS